MQVVAIIPARYGSTRFPGKPLAQQTGKYLIQHVCEQVRAAETVERCIVATDDERIAEAVRSFGGEVAMTSPEHPSGTDRIAEVVRGLPGADDDIVLNIQGDEPEIEPEFLDRLVGRAQGEPADMCPVATLACPFSDDLDPRDPSRVKVVLNQAGRALYFSRSLIPYPRDRHEGARDCWYLHLGVYAYRRAFLLRLAAWPPGKLEQIERLEQLRVLEHDTALAVEIVEYATAGIDTPEDYERFVGRCAGRT